MKAIKVLVLMVLVGCAPYPYKGYYELDDAITHAKTSEESEYYKGKRDQFEKDAEAAILFYELRARCGDSETKFGRPTMWYCETHGSTPRDPDKRPFKDIVDQVASYRRDKWGCGCALRADVMESVLGRRY